MGRAVTTPDAVLRAALTVKGESVVVRCSEGQGSANAAAAGMRRATSWRVTRASLAT